MKHDSVWASWRHAPPPPPKLSKKQLKLISEAGPQEALARLPLYEEFTTGLAGTAPGVDRDPACSRCALGTGKGARCLGGVSKLGDGHSLLVVYSSPTRDEQARQQPFTGAVGYYLRQQVEKHTGGRAVEYAYALGCPETTGGAKELLEPIDTCRPFLMGDFLKRPRWRVLVVGYAAVRSVFGLYVDTTYTRRAWARVRGVPAFALLDPAAALRNRFLRRQFERDLEWALTTDDPVEPRGETEVLSTGPEVEAWLAALDPRKPTVVDVEHRGSLWSPEFDLLCVGLGQDPERPVVATAAALQAAREAFTDWLADPAAAKVNQNIKHDRHALYRAFGVDMRGIARDTLLRAQMREPEAPAGLGKLAWQVGFGGYKEASKDLSDEDEKGGNAIASLSPNDLHAYNGRDIAVTLLVDQMQSARMGKLGPTWDRLVGPAFEALAIVERNGILLSEANVRAYDAHLQASFKRADAALRSHPELPAGFNPNSGPQKAALLYDKLGLPCTVKTDSGGRSTSAEALSALRDKHPIVPLLTELSGLSKQISTYGLNMLDHISPLDGRVHTTFKLVRTDRLSSSEPNMQNVTASKEDGDEGSWARGCYVAAPGKKLVSLDYSQLELRVACMLSGDAKMAAAFETGHDFHRMTGSAAFGVPPEAVTETQRSVGKTLNFAIVFGESEYGIAKKIGKSVEEATELLDSLLKTYDKLGAWLRQQVASAEVAGELWAYWDPPGTRLGWAKRRSLHGLGEAGTSKEAERRRKHWKNVSKNTPIQWLANCFALASLTEAVRWTQEECPEAKVVMAVHDEILLECPEAMAEQVARQVVGIMLSWPSGVVKFKVGAEVGDDWGHMETLKL